MRGSACTFWRVSQTHQTLASTGGRRGRAGELRLPLPRTPLQSLTTLNCDCLSLALNCDCLSLAPRCSLSPHSTATASPSHSTATASPSHSTATASPSHPAAVSHHTQLRLPLPRTPLQSLTTRKAQGHPPAVEVLEHGLVRRARVPHVHQELAAGPHGDGVRLTEPRLARGVHPVAAGGAAMSDCAATDLNSKAAWFGVLIKPNQQLLLSI
jgi:hypothetical protein